MTVIGYIAFGIAIGVLIGWFVSASRQQRLSTARIAEAEGRVMAAEALASEREQIRAIKDEVIFRMQCELDEERQARARLEESQKHVLAEIQRFREIEQQLKEAFKSLSFDALARNSEEFIKLAEGRLKEQSMEGRKELEGKKELIDQNIETIGKTLSEVRQKIEEVGKVSGEKFAEVSTLIKKHEEVTFKLKDTTDHLRQALASSKKRGEWGERMAEDIIRLVGMVEGITYIKQKTLEHAAGRPDYTFLLPNSLKINMDVKFPLENYQHYLEAQSDHERRRYRDELLKNARIMIRGVTNREYINPAENTVDYVLLFIPNEQIYSFINESDPALMDEALRLKVILCSPFTLYAVLAVIRQAVENFNLEKTASEILKLLAEFSKQWTAYKDKFRLMGERLDAAKKEYDALATTRSNMLERPLRKIEDLRQQKSVPLDESIRFDETSLL